MTTATRTATGTALYLRISDDRDGLRRGVERQGRKGRKLAKDRGLPEPIEFCDNDLGAFEGKYRPDYARLVKAIERGEIKYVIALHLSRIWRNRIERAQGIELFAKHRIIVIQIRGGDIDFSTAAGRAFADSQGSQDTAESDFKKERNQEASEERAEMGKDNGGRTLFGYVRPIVGSRKVWHADSGEYVEKPLYAPDIELDPVAADRMRGYFAGFLAGRKVASLAREAGCHPRVMRNRLRNLAYAGVRVHKGAEYPAAWPAIVKRSTVEACRSILSDPKRVTNGGTNERKHLGAGLFECRCGHKVYTSGTGRKNGSQLAYRCRPDLGGCGRQWNKARLDAYLCEVVEERLSRGDLADLLPKERPDIDALNAEAQGIRERLKRLPVDYVVMGMDATQVAEANRSGKARLAEIEAKLAATMPNAVLAELATHDDPVALWRAARESGNVDRQQALVRAIMTVTLDPAPRGRVPEDWHASVLWYGRSVNIGPA